MVTKQCISCRQVKPIKDFSQSEFTLDGYVDCCWICRQAESRKTGIPVKSWAKENPIKHADNTRLYAIKARLGYGCTCDDTITLDELYLRDKGICGICGLAVERKGANMDHKIPLSKGGDHIWGNIQLAHKACNSKKKDK